MVLKKMAGRGSGAANAGHLVQSEIRIIGGEWRSRRVKFSAEEQIRPTPDRVRETLFNWLGQQLDGLTCVDLFAGSGALGLEAASRGAASVTLVERNPRVVSSLQESIQVFGSSSIKVIRADALEFLKRDESVYDLAFLDPPFGEALTGDFMMELGKRLSFGAKVYYECGQQFEPPSDWRIFKQGRAGRVHFHLLQVV
jgi:16S rRNA (guanine966-N2)-methyltransferase